MPSATNDDSVPVQRIPAWRRLGLQLKSAPASEIAEPPKRKCPKSIQETAPSKKVKKGSQIATISTAHEPITSNLSRKKSVTFTPETKTEDGDSIKQLFNGWVADQKEQDPSFELNSSQPVFHTPEPTRVDEQIDPTLDEKERRGKRTHQPKKEKSAKSKPYSRIEKSSTPSTPRPFLQYLKQYHDSRDSWKFNKNHQNHLLKHAFDVSIVPSDHVHLLYKYVRSLQGGVRIRLRDTALAIKVKDLEDGPAGFPIEMADKDRRQRDFDAAIKEYIGTMTAANASSKVGYEEGILLGLSDKQMQKRVAKRMRSEQILAELGAERTSNTDGQGGDGDDDSLKRLRMNDGSSQKLARKRKQRTVVVDLKSSDSSSDEDESNSDGATDRNDETSSSSSSSSSESDSGERGEPAGLEESEETSEEEEEEEGEESDSD